MVEANVTMDKDKTLAFVESKWDDWYVKGLSDFIRVPNLTPMVDPDFRTNGLIEKAMDCVDDYINQLEIKGLSKKIFQPEGSNPLIVYVVEAAEGAKNNVMLYGHLDKQPWMSGWDEGLGPCEPVIRGENLYGRGGADDGYSPFSCMLAVKDAQLQGAKHPRVALVLETEEESGSPNLISLLKEAKDFIGEPDYCFCMDSGAFDYNSLWLTSSLRGITIVDLTVEAAKGGYHSGEVGGIVPETFRIVRQLLDRVEDSKTAECADFNIPIPEWKQKEAEHMATLCGASMYTKYNVHDGV
jgi:acetylornithine deacetylase/succinyl-diaminopimelate desuccinylase-like protein